MSKAPSLRGILFDFDGVLARTMEDIFAAWKSTMSEFGVTLSSEQYFPLEGMSVYAIAKKFCRDFDIDEAHHVSIVAKKEAHYLANYSFSLYPGVPDLIGKLKSAGCRMGIVTAGLSDRIERSVPSSLLDKFDVIVTGDRTQRGKPFPDPYLKGLELLGLQKEECIVVENAPLGIEAAKNAGIYCIAIASTLEREKLHAADEIVNTFADLVSSARIKTILSSRPD